MAKKAKADENGESGPTKMQMVREALEELGSDAKPKEIGEFVKAKYATDVNPQMPNVLLLVDTSGSMEYKTSSPAFPACKYDAIWPPAESCV